jgi:pre-peptidase
MVLGQLMKRTMREMSRSLRPLASRPGFERLEGRMLMAADNNDQIAEAMSVAIGGSRAGSISPATDVDMHKFTVAAGQKIGFDIDRASGSSLDSHLRIFDAGGNELARNDNANAPGESSSAPRESYLSHTFLTAGTYYAGVSGHGNVAYSAKAGTGDTNGSTGGFTLRLANLTPVPLPPTPTGDGDDQISEAPPVSTPAAQLDSLDNGTLSSGTDVDLYKFTAHSPEVITVDVSRTAGSSLSPMVRIFNADGAEVTRAASTDAISGAISLRFTFRRAGTYFVGVSGSANAAYHPVTGNGDVAGSTGGYSLRVRTQGTPSTSFPTAPPLDGDDQLYEAVSAQVGGSVSQAIAMTGIIGTQVAPDTDMYKYTVKAGQRIGFDLDRSAGSSLNSYLRLFDVTGAQLAANDDGAAPGETSTPASYVEYTFATAGIFYVGVSSSINKTYNAVTGVGDLAGSTGSYTLTLLAR